VTFHEGQFNELNLTSSFISNRFVIGQPVRKFNSVGGIVIHLPQMETNIIVEAGVVEVKVNSLRWKFPIPAQKQRWGFITSQIVTNAAKQIEAKVLRIPIVNWGQPVLITNFFDGK
jgi:hypothetical protein